MHARINPDADLTYWQMDGEDDATYVVFHKDGTSLANVNDTGLMLVLAGASSMRHPMSAYNADRNEFSCGTLAQLAN